MKNFYSPEWERISQIIRHYNFTSILSFARHIGLQRSENLYQIKRGNNRISRELAERISEHFPELNKAWILTGEGKMFPNEESNPILKQIAEIPFFPDFPTIRPPADPDKFLYYSKQLIANADFAVRCNTDELTPLYKREAVIFLRRCALDKPVVYGELYFVVTDYCRIYRKLRKAPHDGEIVLESHNREKYDDMVIAFEDIRELYIVE
ncbi:MAG: hypothetical protein LUF87_10675 [Alistipes sp.]|nr:hypothetical protein [Alistipes sp.]